MCDLLSKGSCIAICSDVSEHTIEVEMEYFVVKDLGHNSIQFFDCSAKVSEQSFLYFDEASTTVAQLQDAAHAPLAQLESWSGFGLCFSTCCQITKEKRVAATQLFVSLF